MNFDLMQLLSITSYILNTSGVKLMFLDIALQTIALSRVYNITSATRILTAISSLFKQYADFCCRKIPGF